jgi:hypothetical protein
VQLEKKMSNIEVIGIFFKKVKMITREHGWVRMILVKKGPKKSTFYLFYGMLADLTFDAHVITKHGHRLPHCFTCLSIPQQ